MTIAKFMHVSEEQYASAALPEALSIYDIPLPKRATAGSAGYDFICPSDVTLQPGDAITIPTGIRCEMQPGWVLMLFPRSGLGFRHQVRFNKSTVYSCNFSNRFVKRRTERTNSCVKRRHYRNWRCFKF